MFRFLAHQIVAGLLLTAAAAAQTSSFACLFDKNNSPAGGYMRQTADLSCAFASDINSAQDAGWPRRPSAVNPAVEMGAVEMAQTVAACLSEKGLRKVNAANRASSFTWGGKSDAEVAAAMCECNQRITTRKLTCIAQSGGHALISGGLLPLKLNQTDITILAHAVRARCVAILFTEMYGDTGHAMSVIGGSLNQDGTYDLELREPNLPDVRRGPVLHGSIDSKTADFTADRYFWTKNADGEPALAYPYSPEKPEQATIMGYVLKCPVPESSSRGTAADPVAEGES